MKGRIKMYQAIKGFGFIMGEDNEDYFFHVSQVKSIDSPEQGLVVEFEPASNEKGLYATDVVIQKTSGGKFIALGNVRLKASNIKDYGISAEERCYQKVYKWRYEDGTSRMERFLGTVYIKYDDTGEWFEISKKRYESIAAGSEKYYHVMKANKGDIIGRYYSQYWGANSNMNEAEDIMAPYDGIFDLNDEKYGWKLTKRNSKAERGDVKQTTEEYLYITTYQGDNYVFYESQANFNIYDKLSEIDELLLG